jgi:cytochrome c-type biogenesis protein CcmH/NrfG
MDAWLKNLYDKNKVLFWIAFFLLLPAILIFLFRDLILKLIVNKANSELHSAQVSDARLEEKQSAASKEASEHKANAESIQKQIDGLTPDEDWNKKRKGQSDASVLLVIFVLAILYFIWENV